MNEDFTIIGGRVSFTNEDELYGFLETFNKEDALRIIETALDVATSSRIFDLKESYVLYKCILKLKEK